MSATESTERWFYMGRRLSSDGKLFYAWHDAEGETRLFGKLKGTAIGRAYDIDVTRDGDKISASREVRLDMAVDAHDLRDDWQMTERADLVVHERAALERKLGREDDALVVAMRPLQELYGRQRTWAQKAALRALVQEALAGW